MMKEVIKEAKSVEEAINLACEELKVTKDDITFEILELPKKGIFGFRNTMAKVKVALINEDHLESDAESKGYDLNVEDVTVYEDQPSKYVTLTYYVSLPVFSLFGTDYSKQAVIEGYAR